MNINEIKAGDVIKVTQYGRKVGRVYNVYEATDRGYEINVMFLKVNDGKPQGKAQPIKWIAVSNGIQTIELISREMQVA